jgi:hypothetical protein
MRRRTIAVLVVGLLIGGGLVACSGSDSDSKPAPGPSTSSSASPGTGTGAQAEAARKLTAQYLATPTKPTVLASVKGTVRDGSGKDVPGTLDLLAVTAGTSSTAVRWRLSSDDPIATVSTNYYNRTGRAVPDTTQVVLVAKSIDKRFSPATWLGSVPSAQECTCAYNPRSLGPEGVELSSLFESLPSTVTEVELRVPGFAALTAPVSRG